MKEYKILTGDNIDDWNSSIFFNTKAYLTTHGNTFRWFKLFYNYTLQLQIIFTLNGDAAYSPFRSPYGGLEVLQSVDELVIRDFVTKIIKTFEEGSVTKLKVSCLPQFYTEFSEQFNQCKPENVVTDKTFYYLVNNKKAYNTTKRNIIKQLTKKGYTCDSITNIEKAYGIISKQYSIKGFPLTMSLDEIKKAFIRFPDKYQLLACFDKEKNICAVLFLVNVSSTLQYVMYNGSEEAYQKDSPLVLLYDYMIQEARENGVKHIDYGIASVGGELNKGLAFFKKSMGGIESDKLSYVFKV